MKRSPLTRKPFKPKAKKCLEKAHGCEVEYAPRNGQLWRCCFNPACIAQKAAREREKKAAKDRAKSTRERREGREATMTMRKREARAREAAQEFARKRDMKWFTDRGESPKCILCGRSDVSSWHGCHFVPVGSRGGPRSFHPANINLGCGQCNYYADQGSSQYEENMIRKYGQEMVTYLKTANLNYTMTVEEVEEIRAHYKQLAKEIKEGK